MMGLTKLQTRCLDFIADHQKRNSEMPSLREIARALELKSLSGVLRLLDRLEERGAIKRLRGKARAIALKIPKCPHCGKPLRGPKGGPK